MSGKIHENTQVGSSSTISFIIKKPKAKVISYYAGGAIALGVATSGFFHDYFLIGIVAPFGVLGMIAGLEVSYGRTKVSQSGVQYAIVYGVIPLWKFLVKFFALLIGDSKLLPLKNSCVIFSCYDIHFIFDFFL